MVSKEFWSLFAIVVALAVALVLFAEKFDRAVGDLCIGRAADQFRTDSRLRRIERNLAQERLAGSTSTHEE